jgi:hypothetical protein
VIEALTAAVIVTGIGMCVIDELENTPESGGVPPNMRVCLLVPGNIAWDGCDCGQFAQTIQADYPTSQFPFDVSEQVIGVGGCGSRPLVYQVLASIIRCVPGLQGPSTSPRSPSCDKLQTAAFIMEGDAFALRRGVECCLSTLQDNLTIAKFVVGRVSRVGPEGNCAGVELTYKFELI